MYIVSLAGRWAIQWRIETLWRIFSIEIFQMSCDWKSGRKPDFSCYIFFVVVLFWKKGFQPSEIIYLLLRTFGTFLGGLRIRYLRPGFAHNLPTNICGPQLKFKTTRLFEPIVTVSTQQLCENRRFDRFSQVETLTTIGPSVVKRTTDHSFLHICLLLGYTTFTSVLAFYQPFVLCHLLCPVVHRTLTRHRKRLSQLWRK